MGNESSRNYKKGDILYRKIERSSSGKQIALFYNHYGVYIGDGMVIDLTRENGIQRRSVSEFANDCEVHITSYESPRSREEIVETAEYYLKNEEEWGEYSLVSNNCEHFATYCATGVKISGQIEKTAVAVEVGMELGRGILYAVGRGILHGVAAAIFEDNGGAGSSGNNEIGFNPSSFSNSGYNGGGYFAGPSRYNHLDTILERAFHNFPVDPPTLGPNDLRYNPSSFGKSSFGSP